MGATLNLVSPEYDIRVYLTTPTGQVIDGLLRSRLDRGLKTPIRLYRQRNGSWEGAEVRTMDDFTMTFSGEAEDSFSETEVVNDVEKLDSFVENDGYLKVLMPPEE